MIYTIIATQSRSNPRSAAVGAMHIQEAFRRLFRHICDKADT